MRAITFATRLAFQYLWLISYYLVVKCIFWTKGIFVSCQFSIHKNWDQMPKKCFPIFASQFWSTQRSKKRRSHVIKWFLKCLLSLYSLEYAIIQLSGLFHCDFMTQIHGSASSIYSYGKSAMRKWLQLCFLSCGKYSLLSPMLNYTHSNLQLTQTVTVLRMHVYTHAEMLYSERKSLE